MVEDHDRRLLAHVRPPEWVNPAPQPVCGLVVIARRRAFGWTRRIAQNLRYGGTDA